MGIRTGLAHVVSAVSTAALKHVFHRPAANFPGKVALYIDPRIIAHTVSKLKHGSICVVGTNGKTTVTNMVADALETAGMSVVCNRTGANLDSGVATSLLHAAPSDWGVFESDELWLAKSLPQLESKYVLLLNLFRDQLDRCGEIDRIQNSIAAALAGSPHTILVYNGDDPLCEAIARRVPNECIAFGVGEDLGLSQNTVSDARICQECESMLEYSYRQYGQLGKFFCRSCGFARAPLHFAARDCHVGPDGMAFGIIEDGCAHGDADSGDLRLIGRITAPYSGIYMIYNLLAVFTVAHLAGAGEGSVQHAVDAFDPQNGRLQYLEVAGRRVLLNLAKNPTGFNQNLKLVTQDAKPKAAAFFINDREADGRDISWIWDVDFEELAAQPDTAVFAGGIRRNDLQLRLKYAGVYADLVESAEDAMVRIGSLPVGHPAYMIANYTSLPSVRAELVKLAGAGSSHPGSAASAAPVTTPSDTDASSADAEGAATGAFSCDIDSIRPLSKGDPLRIVHMFPDLLNLYGDGGNVKVLQQRCLWRGIPVETIAVQYGETVDFDAADIIFLGGGPDREQKLASEELLRMKDALRDYVMDDGVVLAICGGFQILGPTWLMGDGEVAGLGLIDIQTRRVATGPDRLIGNIVLRSPLAVHPVVGYENHAGRTYLGNGLQPFGRVANGVGRGNNDRDAADGVLYRNVVGTYLHGPLLGKNPEVADCLIRRAIERRIGAPCALPPLDDAVELAANAYMQGRLGICR